MRKQRIVFTNFDMPRDSKEEIPESRKIYLFNVMLFEISSNWDIVKSLMDEIYNQGRKEVDPLEREWLNFIISNGIDISSFSDSEVFLGELLKK